MCLGCNFSSIFPKRITCPPVIIVIIRYRFRFCRWTKFTTKFNTKLTSRWWSIVAAATVCGRSSTAAATWTPGTPERYFRPKLGSNISPRTNSVHIREQRSPLWNDKSSFSFTSVYESNNVSPAAAVPLLRNKRNVFDLKNIFLTRPYTIEKKLSIKFYDLKNLNRSTP